MANRKLSSYAAYGKVPWVTSVFSGLKAAIVAIVVSAVIKIGFTEKITALKTKFL